jgi:hypothetical protein
MSVYFVKNCSFIGSVGIFDPYVLCIITSAIGIIYLKIVSSETIEPSCVGMVLGLRNNSTVFEELEVSIVDLMVANGDAKLHFSSPFQRKFTICPHLSSVVQRCLLLRNFRILHRFSVENTGYGFVPETTVSARIRIFMLQL